MLSEVLTGFDVLTTNATPLDPVIQNGCTVLATTKYN